MATIFVSCPSSHIPLAREVMRACTKAGHSVTFDWTPYAERAQELSFAEIRNVSKTLKFGVEDADFVLVVVPLSGPSFGCGVELGLAWGAGKRIVIAELGDETLLQPRPKEWIAHPFRLAHFEDCYGDLDGALQAIERKVEIDQWMHDGPPPTHLLPDGWYHGDSPQQEERPALHTPAPDPEDTP